MLKPFEIASDNFMKMQKLIVSDGGEAVIFDTPTDNKTSAELLDFLADKKKLKITAVIPMHWHTDNLGDLSEFHKRGIPYFSAKDTQKITLSVISRKTKCCLAAVCSKKSVQAKEIWKMQTLMIGRRQLKN